VLAGLWGIGFVFTAAGSALALLGLMVLLLRPAIATQAAAEHTAMQTSAGEIARLGRRTGSSRER
jgi:hypothetical protein